MDNIENNNDSLRLVVLENCKDLGEKINKEIQIERNSKIDYIIKTNQVRFSNGEGKIKLESSVRGKDVFIISDVGNYDCSYECYGRTNYLGPDEHFADIKRVISAIRGNARRISVIMPYLYESRQHVRNGRESLDCAIALRELEHMGVSNIITFDAHDPNIQNSIPLLSFDNFIPTNSIIREFIKEENIDYNNLLVISPDAGAMKRSRYYAGMFNCDIGMFYKRRDYSRIENGKNPVVEHKYLGKNEDGLDYIIVDDMIASGGSIIDILGELKEKKPHNVYVISTFAFFTEGPDKFIEAYENGCLTKMYTTNLSYIPGYIKEMPWLDCVDCSKLLAEVIDYYNKGKAISPLLNGKKEIYDEIQNRKS